jgi:hypothetical protein
MMKIMMIKIEVIIIKNDDDKTVTDILFFYKTTIRLTNIPFFL